MTKSTPTRIAMWSGPRNISTALMRAWENRADTSVIDEPLYGVYLTQTGLDHPGREVFLPKLESDEAKVIAGLTGRVPGSKPIFYQKHMAHHVLSAMDRAWMAGVRHAFLIRDPAAVLVSYVKSRGDVTLDDLGIVQQVEIFEREADRLGAPPPVIEGDQILADPQTSLTALCAGLGVPFDRAMLSWPAGKRDSDGPWAPWWYKAVETSTGFIPRPTTKVEVPDALKPLADEARPYYEKLRAYRLSV